MATSKLTQGALCLAKISTTRRATRTKTHTDAAAGIGEGERNQNIWVRVDEMGNNGTRYLADFNLLYVELFCVLIVFLNGGLLKVIS